MLNDRAVGPGHPPYIIAEIGSNHNGDVQLCKEMIDVAHDCGADAVKLQSWSESSLISKAEYARNTEYSDKERHFGTLEEMVRAYQVSDAMHEEIAAHCARVGIDFLSSAFSPREVDLLRELGVPAIKIASMDINHLPLLAHAASTGIPIILSTGMASLDEVAVAVRTLQEGGDSPVALLHCISVYPPEHDAIHLRNIPMLAHAFDLPVGFSDHSLGVSVPLAAIALGASIIEKHFTLDKHMPGWDHAISADPDEMRTICREGRNVFEALGSSVRTVSDAEMKKRRAFRRRIVLARAVPKGHVLTLEDLDFKRPGTGIAPSEYPYVVARTTARALEADHELEWGDLVR